MEFRFDYSTFFWLLPLDVHNLIPLYVGAVRKTFQLSKTCLVPFCGELLTTRRGSVVHRKVNSNVRHRKLKLSRNMVADKFWDGLYESTDGKTWHRVVSHSFKCVEFCFTPDNGCVVSFVNDIIKYDNCWNIVCRITTDVCYPKIACQSNGNVVSCSARTCQLYSPDLRFIRNSRLPTSDFAYGFASLAIDVCNQILIHTQNTFYLYSSDLSQLHYIYDWFAVSIVDLQIDNRGRIFVLEHTTYSNKIIIFE